MGAVVCGGVGIGAFDGFHVISRFNRIRTVLEPRSEHKEIYDELYFIFNRAYEAMLPIYELLGKNGPQGGTERI